MTTYPYFTCRWLRNVSYWLLCALLLISVSVTEQAFAAQESASEVARKSASEWMQEANSLRIKDKKASFSAAKKALLSAQQNDEPHIEAEAAFVLGEVSKKLKRYQPATEYFQQSADIYKKIEQHDEFILSSIESIKMMIIDKDYYPAHQLANRINNLAMEHEYEFLTALTLTTKGDIFYKEKQFKAANIQYIRSLMYLTSPDKKIRKKRGDTYKVLAQSYKRLKEPEQVAFYYKKALEDYSALNNKKLMARTMNNLIQAESKLEKYSTALEYASRSLVIYDEINDPEGRAKANSSTGILYRYIGLYEKSLNHLLQAHEYYKEIQDIKGIAKSSNQIGLIYTRLKQFELAKSFYQKTLNLPEKKLDILTIASATRELAVISLQEEKYEQAKEPAYKALHIYERKNDIKNASLTSRIIANIYRGEANYDAAISYYKKSFALAQQIGNKTYQIKAKTPLAIMVLHKGDAVEAKRLLKEALQVAIQINNKPQQLYAYRDLKIVEKSQGNYQAALEYAEQESLLKEVIQTEKDEQEIARVKAKLYAFKMEMDVAALEEKAKFAQLQLDQKDKEIELAEQAQHISELELTKKLYANLILAALFFLCLIAVFYVYRLFRSPPKT